MAERTDVFVIGGGPAGLAAAIAARRAGLRVTLADQSAPGADKACGEGLLPETLSTLSRLGVEIPRTEGQVIRGICFVSDGHVVSGRFAAGHGLGVPRPVLHRILAEHAAKCGVELMWRTSVREISEDGLRLSQGAVRARWIIAADGGNSRLRNWAGLGAAAEVRRRFGFRRHYAIEPWSDEVEVYWGDECQIYVSPVGRQNVCVALLSRSPKLRIADALQIFPALAARLASAEPIDPERGATCATLRLDRVFRGNVALIGDASGSVDAITGQGLYLAFSQALALAGALARGNLMHYQAAHRRIARRPVVMARLLLALDGRPRLRRRVMQLFADDPGLMARLLAFHTGSATAADSAMSGLRLGWRLVTA